MEQAEWDRLIEELRDLDDFERAVEASNALRGVTDPSRIPELERLVQDEENWAREAAATALINLKGLKALPLLLHALELGVQDDEDNDTLAFEIVELVESQKDEAAPMLLEMLRSPRPEARSHAAWLLGFFSGEVSPEPLIEASKDPSPDVRSAALGSLSSFRGHSGVLAAMLSQLEAAEEDVRVSAASALGYFGDRSVVPDLLRAMGDPAERVRRFAHDALERLGVDEKP